jgi:prepilin-type N-terminal cleavage/methylation domain-containing protein
MHNRKQAAFTLIEIIIVIAALGILAAIAIPNFADYRRRGLSLARTYDTADTRIVMTALKKAFSQQNMPLEIIEDSQGYIETAWVEYLGEEGHGLLRKRWEERKKYVVEIKRELTQEKIRLNISILIQEKPPNDKWADKDTIRDGTLMPEVRGGLNSSFERYYSELKLQRKGG